MPLDIILRSIDLIRLVNDRRCSDFPEQPGEERVAFASPVIHVQERIPAEYQIRVRLLLDIRLYFIGTESLVVLYQDFVLGQTVFSVLKDSGRTAGLGKKRQSSCH